MAATWLIDGFNVLHAGWEGGGPRADWWTRARREGLVERLRGFDEPGAELVLVFDGRDGGDRDSAPRVVYAAPADEWIVRRVKAAAPGEELVVVSGDRRLGARCRHHGARVVSPRAFLARCEPKASGDRSG